MSDARIYYPLALVPLKKWLINRHSKEWLDAQYDAHGLGGPDRFNGDASYAYLMHIALLRKLAEDEGAVPRGKGKDSPALADAVREVTRLSRVKPAATRAALPAPLPRVPVSTPSPTRTATPPTDREATIEALKARLKTEKDPLTKHEITMQLRQLRWGTTNLFNR